MRKTGSDNSWRKEIAASRRKRTRDKLIAAAARTVAEIGEQRARIDDIIAAAGVARGTFYNYYSSIEELLDDLWERVGREPFKRIQTATRTLPDPAERLAAEARLVLELAAKDHSWGWLLYAFSAANTIPEDLLSFPRPDLLIGRTSERFKFTDLDSASDLVVGALRASLHGILERGRPAHYAAAMVILLLKALGIPEAEAVAISMRPLPEGPDTIPRRDGA